METDVRRRDVLVAALPWFPAAAAARASIRLAAAWDGPRGSRVGLLHATGSAWQAAAEIEVPTRAHGVIVEPEGTLLAVARRPGDWLLRWRPRGRARWAWSDPARHFNGHVRRRGGLLYTTETDLETGQGRVVVRDAGTFEAHAVWRSFGVDPHDLLFGADGSLWVANGGIETQPETGRAKLRLEQMDSSLVRLDPSGRLLGQWRLDDPRLSLRHLAEREGMLGIALQAEHDDAARRAQAPVLALLDGKRLRAAMSPPVAGYGGDIAATSAGFAVSVPREGGIALFDRRGGWLERVPLDQACALAVSGGVLYAGGADAALALEAGSSAKGSLQPLRLDNHWRVDATRRTRIA
jgi:uncharacterized protein